MALLCCDPSHSCQRSDRWVTQSINVQDHQQMTGLWKHVKKSERDEERRWECQCWALLLVPSLWVREWQSHSASSHRPAQLMGDVPESQNRSTAGHNHTKHSVWGSSRPLYTGWENRRDADAFIDPCWHSTVCVCVIRCYKASQAQVYVFKGNVTMPFSIICFNIILYHCIAYTVSW